MNTTIVTFAVKALIANGIDQLYCLPGVQNDHFFNALFDHTDMITPIQTRHEQSAAYMATGAALATGEPQVYCVVPGPGFLNTTATLSTAYALNAPVMALVGQIPTDAQGKGHGLLHEIPDQIGILESLTKSTHRITGSADAPATLAAAFSDLASGRPRPVGLEIAVDLWTQAVEGEIGDLAPQDTASPEPDSTANAQPS